MAAPRVLTVCRAFDYFALLSSLMSLTIRQLTACLEQWAPPVLQENYDNSGLLTGDPQATVRGVLTSLDCTEEVVAEALRVGANVIVAHHPVIFGGLKRLTGQNSVQRTVIQAIRHDIALYAIHTNLDHIATGVNRRICDRLGLIHPRILAPKRGLLRKLTTFVPPDHKDQVLHALSQAGAGHIGNYAKCSFQIEGIGTFEPNDRANPFIGQSGQLETVQEIRIEVIFPSYAETAVMAALRQAHPYEEVAYYLHSLENEHQDIGSGMIGELPEAMTEEFFIQFLKKNMQLQALKHTPLRGKSVKKVAVCGGSGSFLLRQAVAAQADVYVSADFKYHEYFEAEGRIVIADIGHYESEVFTKDLLAEYILQQFPQLPVHIAQTNTNPVRWA